MHDDGYFDERIARSYDDDAAIFEPEVVEPVVDLLETFAGTGRALEFGIGTGRIALPLAGRGIEVHGIEMSKAMAARLRAKPGGHDIGVTIGDFATAAVAGPFSLVYLAFNTINNLITQAAQVACFQNAAAHLRPGGCFVVEVGVPALQRLPQGETLLAFRHGETHWGIDEYDMVTQAFTSHHLRLVEGRVERFGTVSLCLAGGAGSDGEARRHDAEGPLRRLAGRGVHQRQYGPCLDLGEALGRVLERLGFVSIPLGSEGSDHAHAPACRPWQCGIGLDESAIFDKTHNYLKLIFPIGVTRRGSAGQDSPGVRSCHRPPTAIAFLPSPPAAASVADDPREPGRGCRRGPSGGRSRSSFDLH
jgi:SAM-dependent methyltransferase